jgi:hypothetical protein
MEGACHASLSSGFSRCILDDVTPTAIPASLGPSSSTGRSSCGSHGVGPESGRELPHKPHDVRQLSGVSNPASEAYMLH